MVKQKLFLIARRHLAFIMVFSASLLLLSKCQSPAGPQKPEPNSTSSISFKITAAENSVFSRLAHEIYCYVRAPDMPILEFKFLVEKGKAESTLTGIPAGKDRIIELYVKDKKGKVQYIGVDTTDIIADSTIKIMPIVTRINGNVFIHYQFPSDKELVAYYPFNGNAKDSSEYFNNGHLKGREGKGPKPGKDRMGLDNRAYYFSGTDEHINCGQDISLDIAKALSFSLWLNIPEQSADASSSLINKSYDHTSPRGVAWNLSLDTNLNVIFELGNKKDSLLSTLQSKTKIKPDKWRHVAATFDGKVMRIFIDGEISGTKEAPMEILTVAGDLLIGTGDFKNFFNGSLDDVMIYQKALTTDEIKQLAEK